MNKKVKIFKISKQIIKIQHKIILKKINNKSLQINKYLILNKSK